MTKFDIFTRLLDVQMPTQAIVFCITKKRVDPGSSHGPQPTWLQCRTHSRCDIPQARRRTSVINSAFPSRSGRALVVAQAWHVAAQEKLGYFRRDPRLQLLDQSRTESYTFLLVVQAIARKNNEKSMSSYAALRDASRRMPTPTTYIVMIRIWHSIRHGYCEPAGAAVSSDRVVHVAGPGPWTEACGWSTTWPAPTQWPLSALI